MLIGNGYLEFKSRKEIYRVNPGDIFMNNGCSILFLPEEKHMMYGYNHSAQSVPKREWDLLALFLVEISFDEVYKNALVIGHIPSIDVKYFEFV